MRTIPVDQPDFISKFGQLFPISPSARQLVGQAAAAATSLDDALAGIMFTMRSEPVGQTCPGLGEAA